MTHYVLKFSFHHSVETTIPDTFFTLAGKLPSVDEMKKLIEHMLWVSPCHADWPCDNPEWVYEWVETNYEVLVKWLFTDTTINETFQSFNEDSNALMIFNEPETNDRNIGWNTPEGSKYDGIWFQIVDVTDDVKRKREEVEQLSREVLVDFYLKKQFGEVDLMTK